MPLKMYQKVELPSELSSVRHIIGVAAGKGGVGKSTVTVNLARALNLFGFSVGILDTDIYGPSIRKMLPEDRLPGRRGDKLIPALSDGMKIVSLAYFRKENEVAAIRAPIANGVINQFLKNVHWGELDFLIIDFPPGTGDIQLTLSQQANLTAVIMVTTPQEVSVMDVKKAMSLFMQMKIPILGVIENMSFYESPEGERISLFGKGGGEKLSLESGVPFLGQIPIDERLSKSGDTGQSLFSKAAGPNKIRDVFEEIAKKVVEHKTMLVEKDKSILQEFELVWKEM